MSRITLKPYGPCRQRGATLLEALAFLGISAIVIVGAISMFRAAQGSAQTNDMLQQLNAVRSNVRTLMGSQTTYSTGAGSSTPGGTGLNQTLIVAKALPDTLRVPSGTYAIYNGWGGQVRVDGNTTDFFIQYTNVPQEVCVKVASQTGASWQGLQINGNGEVATDTAPYPVPTATAQCTAAGAPPMGANVMTWRGR